MHYRLKTYSSTYYPCMACKKITGCAILCYTCTDDIYLTVTKGQIKMLFGLTNDDITAIQPIKHNKYYIADIINCAEKKANTELNAKKKQKMVDKIDCTRRTFDANRFIRDTYCNDYGYICFGMEECYFNNNFFAKIAMEFFNKNNEFVKIYVSNKTMLFDDFKENIKKNYDECLIQNSKMEKFIDVLDEYMIEFLDNEENIKKLYDIPLFKYEKQITETKYSSDYIGKMIPLFEETVGRKLHDFWKIEARNVDMAYTLTKDNLLDLLQDTNIYVNFINNNYHMAFTKADIEKLNFMGEFKEFLATFLKCYLLFNVDVKYTRARLL